MWYQGKSARPAWASAYSISPVSFPQGQGGAEGIWTYVCVCGGRGGQGKSPSESLMTHLQTSVCCPLPNGLSVMRRERG